MNKFEIIELHNEIFQKALEIYGIYEVIKAADKPEVTFKTRSLSTNGKCWKNGKRIDYNLSNSNLVGEEFVNTISHEIAHWVQFKLYPKSKPHGTEFQRIHRTLGGTGERCSSYSKLQEAFKERAQINNTFEYKCNCKSHFVSKVKHNNMQKKIKLGARFSCNLCKTRVVFVQS